MIIAGKIAENQENARVTHVFHTDFELQSSKPAAFISAARPFRPVLVCLRSSAPENRERTDAVELRGVVSAAEAAAPIIATQKSAQNFRLYPVNALSLYLYICISVYLYTCISVYVQVTSR